MKVLVLGANGMAGHVISKHLFDCGHDVFGLVRKKGNMDINYIIGDATDKTIINEIVIKHNFDYIINCIGILNNDCVKNPENAIFINSYFPHYIASLIKNMKTKLIHLSTDCVFSGENPPYYENSFKDGKDLYSQTKSLGEVNDNKNLTFRTSIIGPDITANGIGLFNWFMRQSGSISGFVNVIWTGISTITLAKAIEHSFNENITGIYHLVNNDRISKYELLRLFNKYHNKVDFINPVSEPNHSKELINTRSDFSFKVPSYDIMITQQKKWIENNKGLYTNYE